MDPTFHHHKIYNETVPTSLPLRYKCTHTVTEKLLTR